MKMQAKYRFSNNQKLYELATSRHSLKNARVSSLDTRKMISDRNLVLHKGIKAGRNIKHVSK